MRLIRWIRSSYTRSALTVALIYAAASIVAAIELRTAGPHGARIAAFILCAAILLTGLLARSPGYPRWALLTAAVILVAGPALVAFVHHDAQIVMRQPVGTLGYSWLYLWLAGTAPAGSKGCSAPWTVVAGSVLLVAGTWLAATLG